MGSGEERYCGSALSGPSDDDDEGQGFVTKLQRWRMSSAREDASLKRLRCASKGRGQFVAATGARDGK